MRNSDPRLTLGGNGPVIDAEDIAVLSLCLEENEERGIEEGRQAGCSETTRMVMASNAHGSV